MKIGFISDTHFKLYKKNNSFLNHVTSAVSDFERYCKDKNVDAVFILGDVFHLKDTVSVQAQHEALKVLKSLMKNFPTYVIPGNHDILSKSDAKLNGLNIFSDSCTLYNDYGKLESDDVCYHFLPYYNDEVILQKLSEIKLSNDKRNILCTHLGLRGFDLDNGHEDVYSELTTENLNIGFHKIFSGHYHSHQTRGELTYVSSPFESHFGDDGLHGFTFYDSIKDEIEFIENKNSPKFVIYELNSKNLTEVSKLKGCFIKLILKKAVDTNLLVKYRDKLIKNNYEVIYEWDLNTVSSKIAIAKEWSTTVTTDPTSLLKSYIIENNFEYSKEELLKYLEVSIETSAI